MAGTWITTFPSMFRIKHHIHKEKCPESFRSAAAWACHFYFSRALIVSQRNEPFSLHVLSVHSSDVCAPTHSMYLGGSFAKNKYIIILIAWICWYISNSWFKERTIQGLNGRDPVKYELLYWIFKTLKRRQCNWYCHTRTGSTHLTNTA